MKVHRVPTAHTGAGLACLTLGTPVTLPVTLRWWRQRKAYRYTPGLGVVLGVPAEFLLSAVGLEALVGRLGGPHPRDS